MGAAGILTSRNNDKPSSSNINKKMTASWERWTILATIDQINQLKVKKKAISFHFYVRAKRALILSSFFFFFFFGVLL